VPRQLRNLKLYWPAGFPLNDNSPISDAPADANIFNSQRDEIASTQFAIDRQVEKGQFTLLVGNLEPNSYGPNFSRLECAFLASKPACAAGFRP
jgi:hypothetical protein